MITALLHIQAKPFVAALPFLPMERFEAPDSDSSYSSSESESDLEGLPEHKRRRLRSSSSSSSTSSSGPSISKAGAQPAGLLLSQLALIDDGDSRGSQKDLSVYAQKGQDPNRVREALHQGCCTSNCKRGLHFRLVMNMVCLFWSLPKVSQDSLLWSMQQCAQHVASDASSDDESDSANSVQRYKISWSLEGLSLGLKRKLQQGQCPTSLYYNSNTFHNSFPPQGHPVCRQAFLKILGISASRLVRTRHSYKGIDARSWGYLVCETLW